MAVIDTIWGMRRIYDTARKIIFEPTTTVEGVPIVATNVQDAISQTASQAAAGVLPVPINISATPYTVGVSDRILLIDTAIGAVTVNMPAAASRSASLIIKDQTGHANANPISVVRSGSDVIDGLTTYPIDVKYGEAAFYPQAGGYYVV